MPDERKAELHKRNGWDLWFIRAINSQELRDLHNAVIAKGFDIDKPITLGMIDQIVSPEVATTALAFLRSIVSPPPLTLDDTMTFAPDSSWITEQEFKEWAEPIVLPRAEEEMDAVMKEFEPQLAYLREGIKELEAA